MASGSSGTRWSQRAERQQHIPPGLGHSHSLSSAFRSNAGGGGGQQPPFSVRSKIPASRRSITPNSRTTSRDGEDPESGRVRVSVRLRPRNVEELSDADFAECVELQPELRRLRLRKNNWSSDCYRFDEVFTESASQKRVYEEVAKPVVESVLNGYNGTVMAYGQTGTGKTYTLGRLGKDDASERGIMIRALEDVISNVSLSDCVEVSYLQLYMESIQDLLAPEKINIPISEDPKTGEVALPGAAIVKIQNLDHFLQILQIGEANRYAANTKLNTESSRSHAILVVYVRRYVHAKEENDNSLQETYSPRSHGMPIVRKSKLLIVDLAGSERLDKSGSEGHMVEEAKFINLSLTSLGKCINALAENSAHIPTRDSKLTRLLRDSFGGSARTSLIITIGSSSQHHSETTSTIMFGQRAMKVVNMVKLKEEFDYESLCRKLESQVDQLVAEIDRQQKLRESEKNEMESRLLECQNSFSEAEKNLVARSEFLGKENNRLEAEMNVVLKELNSQKDQKNLICSELQRLEISLKHSQFLERDNNRLEEEMKNLLKELNSQKAQNDIVSNEVQRLEMNLKHSQFLDKENSRLEAEMKDVLKELNSQKVQNNSMRNEVQRLEMSLKHSEFLAEENIRLEVEMKDIMNQLKHQKDHNDWMNNEVIRLEVKLRQSKQQQHENSVHQQVLADTTQMYEEKVAGLVEQLEVERAHSKRAKEQLDSMEKLLNDLRNSIQQSQLESSSLQKALADTTQIYENKVAELRKQLEDGHLHFEDVEEQLHLAKKLISDHQNTIKDKKEIEELKVNLQKISQLRESTVKELQLLKIEYEDISSEKARINDELSVVRQTLSAEVKRRKSIENELICMKKRVPECDDDFEDKKSYAGDNVAPGSFQFSTPHGSHRSSLTRDTFSGQRNSIARICEEVGLQKILGLLTSGDLDVQVHAVKVVANLAAEDINQEKIVEEGGLDALLMLLRSSQSTTILRVASGAIANLAMNEVNQGLIMSKGGARLLASTASMTDDPQTLRMVAGAIANLCGNENLHVMLREDGGIKALLGMVQSRNSDVIGQVARGIANFAKCESRGIIQGHRKGRSLLMEDGALTWLIANTNAASTSTRRHIELALCHLAQNEDNAMDFISEGGVKELARISTESSREDIRNLAKKTLKLSSSFSAEMQS